MFDKPYHSEDLSRYSFLVTGGAGFVGSNLVEYLLKYKAGKVRVIDNLITGFQHNLQQFEGNPSFEFIIGDISDYNVAFNAVKGIDFVLHQAALGSVPRSIESPLDTNNHNINGSLNILFAAKELKVRRTVYASSSSVYGDSAKLPKKEEELGKPLSPYAVTKLADELYADVFARTYDMEIIGLRYFNIFGPKQNPKGPYAAVIPLFIEALLNNRQPNIYGDGEQLRDFTFIENAVQANIKALFCKYSAFNIQHPTFNIAYGNCVSVNQLFEQIKQLTGSSLSPVYLPERKGDIRKSFADISKARTILDYNPEYDTAKGLELTLDWFRNEPMNR
jgi:UDP-N-acetylglucosamine/UDP-N-acetylgalactosamine 4-epimerase